MSLSPHQTQLLIAELGFKKKELEYFEKLLIESQKILDGIPEPPDTSLAYQDMIRRKVTELKTAIRLHEAMLREV